MADDVCDSWEEMMENGVLEKKLEQIKVSTSMSNDSLTGTSSGAAGGSGGQTAAGGGIRILRRPPNEGKPTQTFAGAAKGSKNYDLNNFVNSQPFVPSTYVPGSDAIPASGRGPQITFEDNTRTQYVPKVKILKRPKGEGKGSDEEKSSRGSATKSYQEREAEYAKARLRILGSAAASEESAESEGPAVSPAGAVSGPYSGASSSSSPNYTSPPVKVNGVGTKSEVPFVREPQGPDGSGGFKRVVNR